MHPNIIPVLQYSKMANNDFDGIRVEMAKGIVEGLKKDLALKTLAKIVAEGKASSEQKEEFDRCIQSGNKMPLPPEVQLYANHPAATPTPDMPSMLLSLPKGNISACLSCTH